MAGHPHTTDSWHRLAIDHDVVGLGTCSINVDSRRSNAARRDSLHGQIDLDWDGASASRGGKERHSWETRLAIVAALTESIHTIVGAYSFQSEVACFRGPPE